VVDREPDSPSPWNCRAEELDHRFSVVARYYLEAVVLPRVGNNCNETDAFHLEQHRRLFCSTASRRSRTPSGALLVIAVIVVGTMASPESQDNTRAKSRHIPLRSRIIPFHLMADVQESQSDKMAHGDR